MKKQNIAFIFTAAAYALFIIISFVVNFRQGIEIADNFLIYLIDLLKILPFTFILIGLFEVWVKRETVEKHLGHNSGFAAYFWVILLGGTTIGPMLVSLPVAYTLYSKGAKLSIIFTYIGAAAVCRIPMTIFEASYIGVKFTLIRYAVSIPLVILSSVILGRYLETKNYRIINNGADQG